MPLLAKGTSSSQTPAVEKQVKSRKVPFEQTIDLDEADNEASDDDEDMEEEEKLPPTPPKKRRRIEDVLSNVRLCAFRIRFPVILLKRKYSQPRLTRYPGNVGLSNYPKLQHIV